MTAKWTWGWASSHLVSHGTRAYQSAKWPGEPPQPIRLANPEILWHSEELATNSEGCLSLPEHYADVTRPVEIRLRYLDYQNEIREIEASGLLATCLQHEIDHLDGVLFVDHISLVKRGMILRKLAKAKRARSPVAA